MAAFDFPTTPALDDEYTLNGVTYRWNGYGWVAASAAALELDTYTRPPQGRLTLVSGQPVMTTNIPHQMALYYTNYCGELIPIFDGSQFVMIKFAELTANMTGVGADKVSDWFIGLDAGGAPQLVHGPDWTDELTRSSPLVRVGGIWLNSAALPGGLAAQRGTYVGTTRSDNLGGYMWTAGAVSTAGQTGWLSVWNAYNRVQTSAYCIEQTASWSYSGPVRFVNNNANNRICVVSGLQEDAVIARHACVCMSGAGSDISIMIGLNAVGASMMMTYSNNLSVPHRAVLSAVILGFNYFNACERTVTVAGAGTFFGVTGGTQVQMLELTAMM